MFHVTKLYTSNYFVKIFFITFCGIIYPIFLKYNNLTFFWAFQLRRRAFRYIFSRLRFRLRLQLRLQKDAAPIPNAKGELKIEKECHFTSSTLLVVLLSCSLYINTTLCVISPFLETTFNIYTPTSIDDISNTY